MCPFDIEIKYAISRVASDTEPTIHLPTQSQDCEYIHRPSDRGHFLMT